MAYIFNHPSFPQGVSMTSSTDGVFYLKELLKAAGWTVTSSGTGTGGTYALSDQLTSPALLNATRAWFAIQDPGGGRALTFQRGTNINSYRVKYASAGGFTAGTPDEQTTPAATTPGEEAILAGSGTDASPGYVFGWGPSSGSHVAYIVADNAPPYGFALYAKQLGNAQNSMVFFIDPLSVGSYSISDTDPVVTGNQGASSSYAGGIFLTAGSPARAWLRKASGTGAFTQVGYAALIHWASNSGGLLKAGGTDPETGEDITHPLFWGRHPVQGGGLNTGWKGVSSLFDVMLSNRALGDTLTRNTTRDRIVINSSEWTMPWNGTVPVV